MNEFRIPPTETGLAFDAWGKRICPLCKKKIDYEALKCNHCTADLDPRAVEEWRARKAKADRHFQIGCGAVAAIVVLGWVIEKLFGN